MLTHSKKEIAKHQLQIQRKGLKTAVELIKEDLGPDSAREPWMTMDNISLQVKGLEKAERELQKEEASPPTLWDKVVLKVYFWAMSGRFD
jgi:hypothetical protein